MTFSEEGIEGTTEQVATVTKLAEMILDSLQAEELDNFVVELEFLDRNEVKEIVFFLLKSFIKLGETRTELFFSPWVLQFRLFNT